MDASALSFTDTGVTLPALERPSHLLVGLRMLLVLPLQSPAPHVPLPSALRQVAGAWLVPEAVAALLAPSDQYSKSSALG